MSADSHPDASASRSAVWRRVWEAWKTFARRVGDVQARLLLAVFYFVVLAPFALAVRLASDPLAIKRRSRRGWTARVEPHGTLLERAERQS